MKKLYFGIYALFIIVFGLLCYLANQFHNFPGDNTISLWLQGITLPFLATVMEPISYLANPIPAIVTVSLVVIVLLLNGRKLEAIFTIALPSVSGLLSYLLKLLVDRPRPGDELLGGGLSFPSGHTTYAVVFFGFLCYLAPSLIKQPAVSRVLQWLLILLIFLTGASRIYLGAHWPSDVLGSLLLSGLLLAPAIVLYNNYVKGNKGKLEAKNA